MFAPLGGPLGTFKTLPLRGLHAEPSTKGTSAAQGPRVTSVLTRWKTDVPGSLDPGFRVVGSLTTFTGHAEDPEGGRVKTEDAIEPIETEMFP